MGILDINQKVEPCTGYQINLQSGATGRKICMNILESVAFKGTIRKFLNIVKAHLRLPTISAFETLFCVNVPLSSSHPIHFPVNNLT
jgi:hypothetical protein